MTSQTLCKAQKSGVSSQHFPQQKQHVTVKLVLLIVFLFLTGPTATHAVASAALVSGMKPKSDVEETENSL